MNFSEEQIKKVALDTISIEATAIKGLEKSINKDFTSVVELIAQLQGRVVVTGIGKSAIIANKIVATLNSTGTPSLFMHAADAIHGDLGMIRKEDAILLLSKSGESPEIKVLIPILRNTGNKLIAITGAMDSFLAKNVDYILDATVPEEACPNNLAPTASTTAQLVLGDALAMALLELNGFSAKDFAKFHPGGALGKKLYLKASDLCEKNEKPEVDENDDLKTILLEMSSKRLGATIVKEGNKIKGIITDGDLRRMLSSNRETSDLKASDVMSLTPKTINKDELAVNALATMREHNISQIIVLNQGEYYGMIHIHDLMKEGLL